MNKTGFVCTRVYGSEKELVTDFFGADFDEDCVEIIFQTNGAVVLVEEEDLDSIDTTKDGQTIIIFRVYETSMAFGISCYKDGKMLYEMSSHDGKAFIQEGNLGSLQDTELETSSLFSKILEDTGIDVWDVL